MIQGGIVSHVLRWLVAAAALLGSAQVAAGAEIGGRVVDPDGRPVKGAKVYVLRSDSEGQNSGTE